MSTSHSVQGLLPAICTRLTPRNLRKPYVSSGDETSFGYTQICSQY